jgi:hypothetical protein
MTRRVVIDRLRIAGLAGAAPTRAQVEAALRQALGAQPLGAVLPVQAHRTPMPAGTTLDGALRAAMAPLRGKST